MLEIDQCINSQRILDTGCYQTKNARLSEDRWLAKYMMQQGASTDEICSKIEELYCSRLDYKPTQEEIDSYFYKRVLSPVKNSTSKLYCNHEICIYQEEVDYINSKLTLPWIKEFAILVLAYFKFHSSTSMFMGHIPSKDLIPFTSIVRRRQQNNNILWQRLKDFDLIEYDEQRFECSVPYLMNSGTPVVTLCTMADIGELCKLIKNEKICIKCGKHFEYTSMTKRDICEDCWKQERLNKQSERHKRARQHE